MGQAGGVPLEQCTAGGVAVQGSDVASLEAVADVAAADRDLLCVLQLVVKLEEGNWLDLKGQAGSMAEHCVLP